MKILLFGVSNVGKLTTGELLAERLGVTFYDLDDEIKAQPGMTLEEFAHTVDLGWRDHLRCCMINKFLQSEENLVLAVSPIPSKSERYSVWTFRNNSMPPGNTMRPRSTSGSS